MDAGEKLIEGEEYLLSFSDQKILQSSRDPSSSIEIEYLDYDCHARLTIPAKNIKEGSSRALRILENVINIFKFTYHLRNVHISKHYFGINSVTNAIHHPIITMEDEEYISHKYDISYSPPLLNRQVIKDIKDSNSTLNSLIKKTKPETLAKLSNVLFWYEKGREAETDHEKFISYWVALEYLIKNDKNKTVKSQMLDLIPIMLVSLSFVNELKSIYKYFDNIFFSQGQSPSELKDIEGLHNFPLINSKIFAEHILKFKKYSSDEYINHRIDCFCNASINVIDQKRQLTLLNNKYRNLTNRIYRIRNNIVHEAGTTHNDLILYANWLEYIIRVLLSNFDSKNLNSSLSWDECKQLYWDWKRNLDEGTAIDLV
ncbi:hypothetical protein NST07_07475 [Paenibacillus sp. FSL L8-0340]|uniref:hypothetical protein n=1 Tax=Paenibacillus sp. FSL L8-0340 TaxID=2954685 RepID=UPI0031584A91